MGVNWYWFGAQFASWIATLFICGFGTGALFAAGAYAPSVQMGQGIINYENGVSNLNQYMSGQLTTALAKMDYTQVAAGYYNSPYVSWNTTFYSTSVTNVAAWGANSKAETGTSVQTANVNTLFFYTYKLLQYQSAYSVNSIGQLNAVAGSPACNALNSTTGNTTSAACASIFPTPTSFQTVYPVVGIPKTP